MPGIRIIYELVRVAASGESVGDDWTFYVHTGAGLVSFNDRLGPGAVDERRRVIGVREREVGIGEGVQFERELWWASGTEHDLAVPEHGAGLFTPVWLPLEPDVEVRRTLEFDVAEAVPWATRDRIARLRFDVEARIEALSNQPAPELDVTPLVPDAPVPKPKQTAGELPEKFTADLEGVETDELVHVVGQRKLLVGRDHAGDEPRAAALSNFLIHHSGFLPGWFEPRAALYELRNPVGLAFWIGENSSMGLRNHRLLGQAFAKAAPPLRGAASEFEVRPSLLVELLGHAHTAELAPAAAAIAELIEALVEQHPERATVERQVFVRTAILDDHSGEWTRLLFVDPTPFAGPDVSAWMVAWTDAWTE